MNIKFVKDGDKDVLVIAIPVSKDALEAAVDSKSGKTKVVATTSGFTSYQTPGGGKVSLSLNLTTPKAA